MNIRGVGIQYALFNYNKNLASSVGSPNTMSCSRLLISVVLAVSDILCMQFVCSQTLSCVLNFHVLYRCVWKLAMSQRLR